MKFALVKSSFYRITIFSLAAALTLSAFLAGPVFASCPNGGSGDDTLACDDADPNNWTGGNGDDSMTQEDTSDIDSNVSGGRGDDTITLDGTVGENGLGDSVYGDGLTGLVFQNGGDDAITINGEVSGDVMGDGILTLLGGNGGNDIIVVNGDVGGDVMGDGISSLIGGSGGDDVIVINGVVEGDVLADGVASLLGDGGDDEVAIGEDGVVNGVIDGGEGTDTLTLLSIYQDILDLLDPSDGEVTVGDQTYTWINFEFLIGKIREAVAALVESQKIVYLTESLLAVNEGDGIKVISEDGPVAFVPFTDLASMNTGDALTYQQPNSGAYVVVTDLGVNPSNPSNHLYQFSIYSAGNILIGEFTIAN